MKIHLHRRTKDLFTFCVLISVSVLPERVSADHFHTPIARRWFTQLLPGPKLFAYDYSDLSTSSASGYSYPVPQRPFYDGYSLQQHQRPFNSFGNPQGGPGIQGLEAPGFFGNSENGGGNFGGNFGGNGGDGFNAPCPPPPDPPRPTIEIGAPPPPGYRVVDNFQQSFRIFLDNLQNDGSGYRNNQQQEQQQQGHEGSIYTLNRIYFSPEITAPRSQPFRRCRKPPPIRLNPTGLSSEEQTNELLHNITDVVTTDPNEGSLNADKTIAVIHLQSYTIHEPEKIKNLTNNTDITEAQEGYGFGGNNFLFGNTDTIVTVFKTLLATNFDQVQGISGNDNGFASSNSENVFGRIRNFVNATQRVHFWSHGRGEAEALMMFNYTQRVGDIDPLFTDTAPVTDTISTVVF